VGNAGAALLDEVRHQLVGPEVIVENHGAHVAAPKILHHAVEKHQRHVLLAGQLEVAEIGGGVGQRHQNALDLAVHQQLNVLLFLLRVFVRLENHDAETGFAGFHGNTIEHLGEKMAGDVRYQHAQRVAAAPAQGGGQLVGLVVQLIGQQAHTLLGGLTHVFVASQRARHRGGRKLKRFGYIRKGSPTILHLVSRSSKK